MSGILLGIVGATFSTPPTPPLNTVAPAVTGTAQSGNTLSCSTGTWTGTATITFAYQWQHTTTNIGGATSSTYALDSTYVGETIRCVVTATNSVGAVSANSNNTAVVLGSGSGVVYLNGSLITSGAYIYNNSNIANTLTVTGATKVVTLRLWGAAGGNGSYSSGGNSGAGGFAKGTVTLQPSTTYYIYVGQGGFGPAYSSFGNGGLGGWPNGGYGTMGDASGAGGGGMSMMSKSTFSTGMSDSDILLIAGAGGGSTGYSGSAGAGGGQSGTSAATATGGSQSVGGTSNGTKLTGGPATGSRTSGGDDGGGGGGGYYGGGGGTSDATPGAGGSGYYNSSLVTSQVLTAGSTLTAPDPDATLNSSYANGRADVGGSPANGRNGLAYITF